MKTKSLQLAVAVLCALFPANPAFAQGTAFTYQGRLSDNGSAANGIYDFQFTVYDAPSAGNPVGLVVEVNDLGVTNGLFTTTIDPGADVFPGPPRWLNIGVRPGANIGAYTDVAPRQALTATPYAITAGNVTGPINGGAIVNGSISAAQLAPGAAANNLGASGQSGVASGGIILSSNVNATELLNAGYVKLGQAELGDLWQARALASAPTVRSSHTAVWTGSEMIIWGGYDGAAYLNTGGRYNPAANTWTSVNTLGAPAVRYYQTAVWNSSEMIVWGGVNATTVFGDGGRYNPVTDQWTSIPVSPLVAPRWAHTAVWTGTEMIVWGGLATNGVALNNGGRFSSTSVTNISLVNAPGARYVHQAVWTGTEMLVWGGALNGGSFYNTGSHYDPVTDTWTPMSAITLAPRYGHTMIWTGAKALVWGGLGSSSFGDGAQYEPISKVWSALTTNNAPAPRFYHQAIWTGTEMIISGGALAFGTGITNVGGRYNPVGDSWIAVSSTNGPSPRYVHSAIWTGTEMIVWGGYSGTAALADGKRYDPASDHWTPTAGAPSPRYFHSSVWTGSELIIWGGTTGGGDTNTGARYSPVSDNWTPTSTLNAPSARRDHAAVWTGTEMLIWGGAGTSTFPGGRYDPVSDSWTAMSTVGAPFSGRDSFASVWTGTEFIIWGGFSGGALTHGGRYSPASDTWTNVATIGAPTARFDHTAVWTGSEMIIWGGNGSGSSDSGGRYSPSSDSWAFIPSGGGGRASHSAIWTGSDMIVWGGLNSGTYLNTGARYNRAANSWTPTTTSGAPTIRYQHTAVWTGSAMIVWGGNFYNGSSFVDQNTGGRYDPIADTWAPTTGFRAPSARSLHTATWTGSEMFVFGGSTGSTPLNSLHSYAPAKTVYLYQKP